MMKIIALTSLLTLASMTYAKDSGIGLRLAHMAAEYSNMGVCAVDVRYILDSSSDDIESLALVLSIKNTKSSSSILQKLAEDLCPRLLVSMKVMTIGYLTLN